MVGLIELSSGKNDRGNTVPYRFTSLVMDNKMIKQIVYFDHYFNIDKETTQVDGMSTELWYSISGVWNLFTANVARETGDPKWINGVCWSGLSPVRDLSFLSEHAKFVLPESENVISFLAWVKMQERYWEYIGKKYSFGDTLHSIATQMKIQTKDLHDPGKKLICMSLCMHGIVRINEALYRKAERALRYK